MELKILKLSFNPVWTARLPSSDEDEEEVEEVESTEEEEEEEE